MQNQTKDYLKNYLITVMVLSLFIGGFNWIVDPYQFYRKAFYSPVFNENQRYQNPGLAKNYEYDTVIIGSSHTENFSPGYINNRLGFNTLKLSISGSSAREQYLILQKAIETSKVKNVIWGVEYRSFNGGPYRVSDKGDFPYYLYHENLFSHTRYLLSLDTFWFSIKALLGIGHSDLETLYAWNDSFSFSESRVLKAWDRERLQSKTGKRTDVASDFNDIHQSIKVNLEEIVRNNQSIDFYLFFPPYSILAFVAEYSYERDVYEENLKFKEDVIGSLLEYDNVYIYDFQHLKYITHDLNNYKDLGHYSKEINEYIIDSLSSGEHLVTRDNYRDFLISLDTQVKLAYSYYQSGSIISEKFSGNSGRPYFDFEMINRMNMESQFR